MFLLLHGHEKKFTLALLKILYNVDDFNTRGIVGIIIVFLGKKV